MMETRMNYCQALGLNPFNTYKDEEIAEAIRKAEDKWTNSLNRRIPHAERHQIIDNLGRIPDMKALMNNEVLRKSEFDKASKYIKARASHLLRCTVTFRNGSVAVIDSYAKKLAYTLKWENVSADNLVTASGLQSAAIPKPAEESTIQAFEMLKDSGFYTPYDFVNHLFSIPGMGFEQKLLEDGDGPDVFLPAIDLLYARREKFSTNKVPEWETYSAVIMKLHEIRNADDLDELTRYGKTYRALEKVFVQLDIDSGVLLDSAYLDDIITGMVEGHVEDKDLAIDMMARYCLEHSYPADFSGENSNVTLCHSCLALTPFRRDVACACALCGEPVRVTCPCCSNILPSTTRRCTECRTDIVEARITVDRGFAFIRQHLSEGDIRSASTKVSAIEAEYPYAVGLPEMVESVTKAAEKFAAVSEEVQACSRLRRFHTLKTVMDEAVKEYPSILNDIGIRTMYEEAVEAVSEADAICGTAETEDQYICAAEKCPDHPAALAVLCSHPPEGPADGSTSNYSDGIIVRYSVPADRRGMVFCIYRGIGMYPEVDNETIPVAETDKGVWLDDTAEPGTACYYRIYSRRWGVLSEEYAEAGPGIIVREVTDVVLTPLPDGISCDYRVPAGANRVRIWRKPSGIRAGIADEVEITPAKAGHFEDRCLVGDQDYSYLFVADYDGSFRSNGTVYRAKTPAYPEPVTDMAMTWNKLNNTYGASWSSTEDVVLFCSRTCPSFNGRAVPLRDLDSWMTRAETISNGERSAVIRIPTGHSVFVTPVSVVGETGIVGNTVLVTNLRPVSNVTRTSEDGIAVLRFPWPEGATGAKVETDNGECVVIDRVEGEGECIVKVPMNTSTHRPVSIYALYDVAGKPMYSTPVSGNIWADGFSRIHYSVSTSSVVNDRNMVEVKVKIECSGKTALPGMIMVMSENSIPLKAVDGTTVWSSDNPVVLEDGKVVCSFFMDKKDVRTEGMRLFFADRGDYGRYRIVHPIYSRRS